MKDVFICHASEDKPGVVYPLVENLKNNNISCWLDKSEIQWGDSITQKVNDGLAKSKYVIVVLSQAFLSKNWPQRELNAVLNIEASNGEVKVLPLIHGDSREILQKLPLLNDKMFLDWGNGIDSIIYELKRKLDNNTQLSPNTQHNFQVRIPNIKKKFTQRDKDLFINNAISKIKEYFSLAAKKTESHYPDINIDITEINTRKFIAKVYHNGNIVNSCNIRIGGILHSDASIGYSEGAFLNDNDNSFNEIVSIEEEENSLVLKFMMGTSFGFTEKKAYNEHEAAEELWRRFTLPLERL